MTAPFEFEEPAEIEASHLVDAKCCRCGARALSTPERAREALCGGHMVEAAQGAQLPAERAGGASMGFGPLVRREMDPHQEWLAARAAEGKFAERAEHPEPECVGEWGEGLNITIGTPATILTLAESAREAGWEVRMRYARGTGIHASRGTPTSLRHSIALGMHLHPLTDRQVRAVYASPASKLSWGWESRWVYGPDITPVQLSAAQLMEFLEEPRKPASWFTQVRAAAAEEERARKVAAKSRPKRSTKTGA